MLVDVTACKRERIKVDVTLAKRGARRAVPAVVSLPVKVAVKPVFSEPEEDFAPQVAETVEEYIEAAQETANGAAPDLPEEQSEEADILSEEECEKIAEETISAIEEMLAEAEENSITDEIEEEISETLEELDEMNRRAEDMKERLDDELEQALDEINESAEEDAEILSSTIGSELEALDNVLSKREKNAEASTVMRYFERDSDGEMVEVESNDAKGQEVVCYDEKSGKLSRICGIIKKSGDDY